MSVKIKRVSCLSLDGDEDLYKSKAVLGDKICVFLHNGMKNIGYLSKIGNGKIVLYWNGVNRHINILEIRTFRVMSRGENCCNFFGI